MDQFQRPTSIDWRGPTHGMARFGEDQNLLVMFYNRSIPVHSPNNDRPIHRDAIYVKIQQPGEMLNIIDRPVNDEDKVRFRDKWQAFIHDRTQVPEGVPITLLFPNHPAVADNLRAYGVYTIEQCAALSAHAIDTIGRGAQEYVNRAKKYLDMANKGSAFHELRKENDELRQEIRVLEQKFNMAVEQINALTQRVTDPVRGSLSPPYVPGVDAAVERINANAPSKEFAEKIIKTRKRKTIEDKITDPFGANDEPVSQD